MRTLFIFLLASYFLLSYSSVSAQSEGYTIESFQDEYTELTDYESISLIFDGNPIWEHEFQLDFQFPFYNNFYDRMIYHYESWGMFTDDEDEALYLMDFTRAYSYASLNDTTDIDGDVRFSDIFFNNMHAFVIQFTNNSFFADPYTDSLDTYLNFQLWFFENGVIEVHFGEMHMDGTPIYAPGHGFYCYDSFNGVDTNEVCGPHVGISNPFDRDDGIAVSGSYDDYEVTSDIYDNLTVLPPPGWIIRFKPKTVGVFDPEPHINQITITPNPASSYINIPQANSKVIIYANSGEKVYEGIPNDDKLSVSSLTTGIYFTKIVTSGESFIGKFLKL